MTRAEKVAEILGLEHGFHYSHIIGDVICSVKITEEPLVKDPKIYDWLGKNKLKLQITCPRIGFENITIEDDK
jgi:hypothetical protein